MCVLYVCLFVDDLKIIEPIFIKFGTMIDNNKIQVPLEDDNIVQYFMGSHGFFPVFLQFDLYFWDQEVVV